MTKVAFLVSFSPMTRVVVEVEDKENLTDMEESMIIRTAREQMLENSIYDYLCGDTLDEMKEDNECPYPQEWETEEFENKSKYENRSNRDTYMV